MQMLVFFIDSNENDFGSGSNIGNLYMNRFIIDEDACHEIVKIYEVEGPRFRNVNPVDKERIGMGHIIFLISNISLFTLSTLSFQNSTQNWYII